MPQEAARSSSPPPPPLLPGMPLPLQGVGVVVRHGYVDVELDVRVILLGEKHGVKLYNVRLSSPPHHNQAT